MASANGCEPNCATFSGGRPSKLLVAGIRNERTQPSKRWPLESSSSRGFVIPPGWDATTVLAAAPFISWSGDVWRVHLARYQAADATGSTIASGRFNRAQREYPNSDHWRVLYLSLGPDTPIGEVLRHFSHRPLAELRLYRRTRLSVSLTAVLDCRDVPRSV